jgi:hypothetical protein
MYLLSLDTARAFDSISHVYIRKLLAHVGLPPWVCNMVEGLLHEVTVVAAIAGAAASPIHIRRGVKQGCPFSPLLFVLCYDVLLWRLAFIQGIKAFAYADDLAVSTGSCTTLCGGLDLIRKFARVSGLGLNMKKTFIVTTLAMSMAARSQLDQKGWSAIRSAANCTYLGVMIGRDVSTREVFAKALAKFFARLGTYSDFLRSCSLHNRIQVANVFLLPLLYYLSQFYLCPYDTVVKPVQLALHRMIVPFRGTAFAYAHLVAARDKGGPFVPLRDIWVTNISMLAATYDLEESDGLLTPAMGLKGHEHWPLTQWKGHAMDRCMTTRGHAAYAAFHMLEDYAPRRHNAIITLEALPPRSQGPKRRKFIYEHLAECAYDIPRLDPKRKTSLDRKINKFCPAMKLGRLFRAQAGVVARKLTPAVWNTQLRLMFNALPFECRRNSARMNPTHRPNSHTTSPFPCYFCGKGEDSADHVFGRCEVVREARTRVAASLGCVLVHDMRTTLLAFPTPNNPAMAVAIVCFNWAVWTERSQYLPTLGETPTRSHMVRRICGGLRARSPRRPLGCIHRRLREA